MLDDWPCPTAKEGPDGCRKRFWSDGKKRLEKTDKIRTYAATRDTYACRFYERITLTAEPGELGKLRDGEVRPRWTKTEVDALLYCQFHFLEFRPAGSRICSSAEDQSLNQFIRNRISTNA